MGCPASPFIGKEKAWVTMEEKEKNERERERKASRIDGSFFSFMRAPASRSQGSSLDQLGD